MKLTEQDLAEYRETRPGDELHPFDADADVGSRAAIAVAYGMIVQADDGSHWMTDKAAVGHRIVRKLRKRNRRGELERPDDCKYQSCPVRPATADEIEAYKTEQARQAAERKAVARKAVAADDFRARTD